MADTQTTYPNTVPLPPLSRANEVAELLVGAIDLHCHSGPAAMPRILDHHEELLDAAAAKFRAVLYKDHFYPGMAHAILLEKLFPECNVRLFSGIALNNASGGQPRHPAGHRTSQELSKNRAEDARPDPAHGSRCQRQAHG
jgi:hypothetical protein